MNGRPAARVRRGGPAVQLTKRFEVMGPVLVEVEGEPIDPSYLKLFKPDTIIVRLPRKSM